ncbi:MAG: ferrochelatase [Gammaproteobacteria bacterium]|nr:ferrochelatase [Gammaproteobacteria bacterium]MDH5304371.1 ferrochelatase [Gammaproteobacteria bacterium]MDH5320969.1 ferrochelatase [Gammaproteobacteria bacterium]
MPKFKIMPEYEHGSPQITGVLLVNLGTPDSPTVRGVRRYLRQFLSDPRVVEYPRALWWLILNGIILLLRPARSAHAYRQIWTGRGSPLLFHSLDLAAAIQADLSDRMSGPVLVQLAMTYGNPSIEAGLDALYAAGARRTIVLPLYPQYSGTTTAAVFDAVANVLRMRRWLPELRFINQYHDNADFIAAHAENIRRHWQQHGRGEHLLFSFHGVPKSTLLNGDPYHCQCLKTARLIAEALKLAETGWSVAFQSRVGREEWLQPYTDEVLSKFGAASMSRVDVVCPGFAVDCLETLEEIALRYAELFIKAGGKALHYIPALNANPQHAALLARLIEKNTGGWLEAAQ